MYLLYADESGLVDDASQQYFVLAGVSVFESVTRHIVKELNSVVELFAPQFPEIELHGSPIRSGKGVFRKRALKEREQLIKDALIAGVVNQSIANVRLFGCVVEKTALVGKDPIHYCFERIAIGFNLFLQARASKCSVPQCGIILFDESTMAYRLRTLARELFTGVHITMRKYLCFSIRVQVA